MLSVSPSFLKKREASLITRSSVIGASLDDTLAYVRNKYNKLLSNDRSYYVALSGHGWREWTSRVLDSSTLSLIIIVGTERLIAPSISGCPQLECYMHRSGALTINT